MRSSSLLFPVCLMVVGLSVACCDMMMMRKGKMMKKGRMSRHSQIMAMEQNISALWTQVRYLSNPVHVHVHGMDGEVQDVVPVFTVDKTTMAEHDGSDEEEEEEEEEKEKGVMMMRAHGHGQHHMMHHGGSEMDRLMEEEEEMKKLKKMILEEEGGDEEKEKDEDSDEEKEKDEDSDESSEEEDEHDEGGGTHVHIHINMGGALGRGGGGREPHPHPHPQPHPQHSHTLAEQEYSYPEDVYVYARCDMLRNNAAATPHNVQGVVYLRQKPNQALEVKVDLYGFDVSGIQRDPGNPRHFHGFHVHEFGDFSNGCNSFGGHYNPEGVDHGGRDHETRHVGDWGNIACDHRGVAKTTFRELHSTLLGPHSIAGRGIVIHERADDHGEGGTEASRASGDAGGRIACCTISWYGGGFW